MSKKYHVSSLTGSPGICRAKDGNCPYGGESGQENHYDTFGEAHQAAQRLYSLDHDILPGNGSDDDSGSISRLSELFEAIQITGGVAEGLEQYEDEDSWEEEISDVLEKIKNHAALKGKDFKGNESFSEERWAGISELFETIQSEGNEDSSEQQIRYELATTNDKELLNNVIQGNVYIRDDWSTVGAALQNPNLSRTFINDVLENPDNYHIETQRWLALNPALTHDEILMLVNERKDLELRSIALRNDSLDRDFAVNFVKENPERMYKLPWFNMTNNPSMRHDGLFSDFIVHSTITKKEMDRLEAIIINEQYQNWARLYA